MMCEEKNIGRIHHYNCGQCNEWPCVCKKSQRDFVEQVLKESDTYQEKALKDKLEKESKRTFGTGANRDSDDGKVNYLECLSPLVVEAYGEYILSCSIMKDGTRRSCDNWKKGMPLKSFIESGFRHFMTVWKAYVGYLDGDENDLDHDGRVKLIVKALCAQKFNINGFLHEVLADSRPSKRPTMIIDRKKNVEKNDDKAANAIDVVANAYGLTPTQLHFKLTNEKETS